MIPKRSVLVLSLAVSALMFDGVPVQAQEQDPGRGATVTGRPRPETDPLGIRAGGFIVFPSVSVTEQFRDNIFFDEEGDTATPNDEQGDFITILSPELLIQSDWSNHALNVFADFDLGGFWINDNENYADWHVGANGRVDITRDTNVAARFDFAKRHESRGSPDDVAGKFPTVYNLYGPSADFSHRFNRVSVSVGGSFTKYDYKDVTTGINEGAGILTEGLINNDDRDRRQYTAEARVGYEIVPQYEAFLRGIYNNRNYDDGLDDGGFNRDSDGWEVVGGTAIDLTGILTGNIFAGYLRQEYDDARFGTVQGPGYGADLTWNPTGLTTVTGAISRTVEETTLVGANGFLASRIALSVDHELLRNLIVSVNGSYQSNDYNGNAREDEIVRAAAQVRYLMSRYLYVTVGYNFQNRESSTIDSNYTVNTFMIRLEGQL